VEGSSTSGCSGTGADVGVGDGRPKWLNSGNDTGEYRRERGARYFIWCCCPAV